MNILIVEDNPRMRKFMRRMLKSATAKIHDIFECEDEAEAIALYKQHLPDYVLMDIKLKNSDGLQATAKIVGSYPDAKVIIVTLYDEPEYRAAARKAGAINYVLKNNLFQILNLLG